MAIKAGQKQRFSNLRLIECINEALPRPKEEVSGRIDHVIGVQNRWISTAIHRQSCGPLYLRILLSWRFGLDETFGMQRAGAKSKRNPD